MSQLLIQSISKNKVIIRKRQHVAGEVMVCFNDKNIENFHITNFEPVEVTNRPGVDSRALHKSNLTKLVALGQIEILVG